MDEQLLIEAATDVKWLKKTVEANALSNSSDHKLILGNLEKINGNLSTDRKDIAVCKKELTRLWWIVGVIVVGILGIAWKSIGG